MSLYFCKKKKNCCKSSHYIQGVKEGSYKFELHVGMHYHDDQLFFFFSYVLIWFLIIHHYLCQCKF
jgi:hypothetical protein